MNGQAGGNGLKCMEDNVARPAHQTCRTISNAAWYVDPARTHIEEANNTMPGRICEVIISVWPRTIKAILSYPYSRAYIRDARPGRGPADRVWFSFINYSLNDRTLRAAKGTPACIIGATDAHEGGVIKSGALTRPRLSIVPHRAAHWTKEPRLVARADPSTPQPRPMMSGWAGCRGSSSDI